MSTIHERGTSKTEDYWLKRIDSLDSESIRSQEEASKQLIALSSILQGIYFAAVSFSDVKKIGVVTDTWYLIFVVLSTVTIFGWAACLFFAMRVLTPKEYRPLPVQQSSSLEVDENEQAHSIFVDLQDYKQHNLRLSIRFLWLSFIPLVCSLIVYLVFLPPIPTS